MTTAPARSHWNALRQQWNFLIPPLRPHASVVEIYAQELAQDKRTLLLGSTPEVATLSKHGAAVDSNPAMLEHIWPHPEGWTPLCADWRDIPEPAHSFGQAIGDAALTPCLFPQAHQVIMKELVRVLRPSSRVVMRLFVQPQHPISVQAVQQAVHRGKVSSFSSLKLMLGMSLCADSADGVHVQLSHLHATFEDLFPNRTALAQLLRCPLDMVDTIDAYKNSTIVYSFARLDQSLALMERHARLLRVRYAEHELTERCPIVVMETPV